LRKAKKAASFLRSTKAIALPVSFLMLFTSLAILMSATFLISVTKINARGQLINVSLIEQSMSVFENSMELALWSPGTSYVLHIEDFGGVFKTEPSASHLMINITDDYMFSVVPFNSSVGQVVYEIPPVESIVSTVYLQGDQQSIISKSSSSMAQLKLSPGPPYPMMTLGYRPLATARQTGFNPDKPTNTIRLYIVNLNSSVEFEADAECYVRITCVNVSSTLQTLNFTQAFPGACVRTDSGEGCKDVSLPMAFGRYGSILHIEMLVCNLKVERLPGGT
jgi:hypothetical protein